MTYTPMTPGAVPRLRVLRLVQALAKAERNGWFIPAGLDRLTTEQANAYADDILDNDGKRSNA